MKSKKIKFLDEFLLNPMKFLSSFDVFGMSSMEFGIYCKILFISWIQKPRQCFLVLEEDNICELCNITKEEWERCKPKILKKFKQEVSGGVTYIYNEVLLSKWHEEIKKLKIPNGEQLTAMAELINYKFDDFWDDYDKKVSDKDRCLPKWLKLTEADRELIREDIPKRKAACPDKKFRPSPEKYLNQKLWRTEIIDYTKNNGNSKGKQSGGYNAEGLNELNNVITGMRKE